MLKWVVFVRSFVRYSRSKKKKKKDGGKEKRKGNKVGGKRSTGGGKKRGPLTRSQVRLERLTFPSFSGRRTLNADYDDDDNRRDLDFTLARYAQVFWSTGSRTVEEHKSRIDGTRLLFLVT